MLNDRGIIHNKPTLKPKTHFEALKQRDSLEQWPSSFKGKQVTSCMQDRRFIFPVVSGRKREMHMPCYANISAQGRWCAVFRKKCTVNSMWSAHWKKRVSQVTSVRLKGSRQGGHEFWERGLPFCFLWQPIRAEKESVANSVINPFITSLLSPQSLVPTCCSYLPLSKALAHHFVLLSWHCTSQVDGRPIHVPEVTPALLWRCCKGCWASRAPSFLHTDCKGLL